MPKAWPSSPAPEQSVEHVVGVTVLAADHPNRRRCSGRRSSPPKQHQADVLRLQARLDPIEVQLKPIEPTHSAPPEHRHPPFSSHRPLPANPSAPRKNTSKKKRTPLQVMTVWMRSLMQLVMLQTSRMVLTRDLP
uniref:Uncharacterized protein n=1 Tax=Oryza punctata TaxID=4537 RepID=A0A0E0LCI3_ORYPU